VYETATGITRFIRGGSLQVNKTVELDGGFMVMWLVGNNIQIDYRRGRPPYDSYDLTTTPAFDATAYLLTP